MAMEAHGDLYGLDEGLSVLRDFFWNHRSSGVHDRDAVEPGIFESFCFLGQLLGCADVGFHQRVVSQHSVLLDLAYRFERDLQTLAGVSPDPQKFQPLRSRKLDVLLSITLCVKEHSNGESFCEIRLGFVQVLFIGQRRDDVVDLVRSDAFGVAELNFCEAVVGQTFEHHSSELS